MFQPQVLANPSFVESVIPLSQLGHALGEQLVPKPVGRTHHARFYEVEDYPQAFVRNEGIFPPVTADDTRLYSRNVRNVQYAADHIADLPWHGIDSLPFGPVTYHGNLYVITQKVDGIPLEEALATAPSQQLAGQVDRLYSAVTDYVTTSNLASIRYISDIVGPQQFMLGTVSGQTEPTLKMVDIEPATSLGRPGSLGNELMYVANDTADAEAALGIPLDLTRRSLAAAIDLMPRTTNYDEAVARLCRFVLLHGEPSDMHLELEVDAFVDRIHEMHPD